MKANFLLISCALVLLFAGCSKDTDTIREEKTISAYDLKVGNSINSFISKVEYHKEYPDLKSLETISADSALWYLESTFNYCYGFPNEFYKSFVVDTLSFSLLLSGNDVNMTDLTDKFNEMIQDVSTTYQAVNFGEKGLSLVNLQEASVAEDQLNFTVQVVTGERGEVPPSPVLDGPFEEGDDWWYGEMEGRCDEFLLDSDAAQQLMLAMNATLPDPEGNFYVIHPVNISRKGGEPNVRRETDPNPPDNIYDYYLFYGNEQIGDVDLCLNRNVMNTYYRFLRQLLLNIIPNEEFGQLNYSLINVTNAQGTYKNYPNNLREYYHEGLFNYGIKIHYVGEIDFPVAID
ncbi:MAG: hypothetical protein M0Q90_09000 [Bacteroidales bacterium]|nr:hypothetical protein [Bacteroidales bacterium]